MPLEKHALGPVSQELSSLRDDLAASRHRMLGDEAARWSCMLTEGTLSAQPLVATLLQPQDSAASCLSICDAPSWVLLGLPGQAGGQVRCLRSRQEGAH